MSDLRSKRTAALAVLALLMATTRFSHTATPWLPADASWAVFFLGGFYLGREWRWALALLLMEAVVIDCLAIRHFGISDDCVTVAYWFIVPGYSVLWLGGAWLREHYQHVPSDAARLLAGLAVSVTVCFLLTQGSFYWLGGGEPQPSVAGWWANFTRWYGHFLLVSCLYVAFAALLQIAFTQYAFSAGLRAQRGIEL